MASRQLKVSDNVVRKLKEIAHKMSGSLEVGFLEGPTENGVPIAAIAFWNEYGHGGRFPAPPRPFFRTMIEKEKHTWPGKIKALAKKDGYDADKILRSMGEGIQGALMQSITELTAPPLSPTTLMLRKKFWSNPQDIRARDVVAAQQAVASGEDGASGTQAKPLIWTGQMLNHTGYRVIK